MVSGFFRVDLETISIFPQMNIIEHNTGSLPPFVKWSPLSKDRMDLFVNKVHSNSAEFASYFLSWHRSFESNVEKKYTSYFCSPLEQMESFARHSGARIWLCDNLVWYNEIFKTDISATCYRLYLALKAVSFMTNTHTNCTSEMNETLTALAKESPIFEQQLVVMKESIAPSIDDAVS